MNKVQYLIFLYRNRIEDVCYAEKEKKKHNCHEYACPFVIHYGIIVSLRNGLVDVTGGGVVILINSRIKLK